MPRTTYLKKEDVEEHGYTENCEGCSRLSAGMKGRQHTEACRKRMYQEMQKTNEGRKWLKEVQVDDASRGVQVADASRGKVCKQLELQNLKVLQPWTLERLKV